MWVDNKHGLGGTVFLAKETPDADRGRSDGTNRGLADHAVRGRRYLVAARGPRAGAPAAGPSAGVQRSRVGHAGSGGRVLGAAQRAGVAGRGADRLAPPVSPRAGAVGVEPPRALAVGRLR